MNEAAIWLDTKSSLVDSYLLLIQKIPPSTNTVVTLKWARALFGYICLQAEWKSVTRMNTR